MTRDALVDQLLAEGVDLSLLPTQIRLLARDIGLPATFALLRVRGGTQFSVPLHAERSELLLSIMDLESAERLCAKYGGQTLTLPKIDKPLRQLRDRVIVEQANQGDSLATLARRYNLTTRQICNILAASASVNRTAPHQGTLF